jgi:enoyl reductase-like protein
MGATEALTGSSSRARIFPYLNIDTILLTTTWMIGDEIEPSYRTRILSSRKGEVSFFKLRDFW